MQFLTIFITLWSWRAFLGNSRVCYERENLQSFFLFFFSLLFSFFFFILSSFTLRFNFKRFIYLRILSLQGIVRLYWANAEFFMKLQVLFLHVALKVYRFFCVRFQEIWKPQLKKRSSEMIPMLNNLDCLSALKLVPLGLPQIQVKYHKTKFVRDFVWLSPCPLHKVTCWLRAFWRVQIDGTVNF